MIISVNGKIATSESVQLDLFQCTNIQVCVVVRQSLFSAQCSLNSFPPLTLSLFLYLWLSLEMIGVNFGKKHNRRMKMHSPRKMPNKHFGCHWTMIVTHCDILCIVIWEFISYWLSERIFVVVGIDDGEVALSHYRCHPFSGTHTHIAQSNQEDKPISQRIFNCFIRLPLDWLDWNDEWISFKQHIHISRHTATRHPMWCLAVARSNGNVFSPIAKYDGK